MPSRLDPFVDAMLRESADQLYLLPDEPVTLVKDGKPRKVSKQPLTDQHIYALMVEVAPPVVETVAPVKPAYGTRTVKEEVKFHLDTVTSWELLFAHYKTNSDVQALLLKLASADIKAGRTVPGTTTREGLI